eukprot:Skav204564  [mRNA]  locus=scaffold2682:171666:172289:+ [translate_table: standard]
MALGNRNCVPALPWEQSPFTMNVLGGSNVPWLAAPVIPRSVTAYPVLNTNVEVPIAERKRIIRDSIHEKAQSHADTTRALALLKWNELFMMHPSSTWPGQLMLDCYEDENKLMRTLEDLFRRKATSTLRIHVGSLSLFFAWMCAENPDVCPFPIQEQYVYEYACMCRSEGTSPSRVDTLIASLRFAGALLKFPGASEAVDSARVQGS